MCHLLSGRAEAGTELCCAARPVAWKKEKGERKDKIQNKEKKEGGGRLWHGRGFQGYCEAVAALPPMAKPRLGWFCTILVHELVGASLTRLRVLDGGR